MIKSITPLWTALLLLGGSFLILTVPNWMMLSMLLSMVIGLMIHMVYKHQEKCIALWHFCAEFLAFCFLVGLFVITTLMMSDLLSF